MTKSNVEEERVYLADTSRSQFIAEASQGRNSSKTEAEIVEEQYRLLI